MHQHCNNADKLWPSDKYGFKMAYAINVNNQKWIIKKPGGEQKWEVRPKEWTLFEESNWRK